VKRLTGRIRALALSAVLGGTLIVGLGTIPTVASSAVLRPAAQCYPPGTCAEIHVHHVVWLASLFGVSATGFAPHSSVSIQVCSIRSASTKANSSGGVSHDFYMPGSASLGRCEVTAQGPGAEGASVRASTPVRIVKHPTHTRLIFELARVLRRGGRIFRFYVFVSPVNGGTHGTVPTGYVHLWAYPPAGKHKLICDLSLHAGHAGCRHRFPERGVYAINAFYQGNKIFAKSRGKVR
jgi:hypothetical protein